MTVIRRFLIVFAVFYLIPAEAGAQGGAPAGSPAAEALLQQAEKFYEQLEYESALQALIRVHQAKGVAPMQRARSFLYMGVCFTALGKAEDAVQSFMALLKLKPDFRLPKGVSPSIQAMFKEALMRLKMPAKPAPQPSPGPGAQPGPGGGRPPVAVEASAPRKVVAGRAIEITVKLKDPAKVISHIQVRWRRVKGPEYSTIKVKVKPGQEVVKARISGATLAGKKGRVVYFVEALARGSMTVAHDGTMDEPLVVRLKAAPEGSSNAKWWIIGIGAGLAVAGGVVAAVLLTRPDAQQVYPSTVQPPVVLK